MRTVADCVILGMAAALTVFSTIETIWRVHHGRLCRQHLDDASRCLAEARGLHEDTLRMIR